jgi:hypothetical protein
MTAAPTGSFQVSFSPSRTIPARIEISGITYSGEAGRQPGRLASAQPLVRQQDERDDSAEQRSARVADARERGGDPLLGVPEKAERDHVVDHGDYDKVGPYSSTARQALTLDEQHHHQDCRADSHPAKGDLERRERAYALLDEKEAQSPEQRQRQVLQVPA